MQQLTASIPATLAANPVADISRNGRPASDPIQELRRAVNLPIVSASAEPASAPHQATSSSMGLLEGFGGQHETIAAGKWMGIDMVVAPFGVDIWRDADAEAQQAQSEQQYQQRLAAVRTDFQRQLAAMQVACSRPPALYRAPHRPSQGAHCCSCWLHVCLDAIHMMRVWIALVRQYLKPARVPDDAPSPLVTCAGRSGV